MIELYLSRVAALYHWFDSAFALENMPEGALAKRWVVDGEYCWKDWVEAAHRLNAVRNDQCQALSQVHPSACQGEPLRPQVKLGHSPDCEELRLGVRSSEVH